MNQVIYHTDRLKIGFILSYMNDGKAANWKEYYLDTLEDPVTGMPNFPTLVTFLKDVRLAFRATDQVRDAVNRLEILKQGEEDGGGTSHGILADSEAGRDGTKVEVRSFAFDQIFQKGTGA
jgi:hypothetical protein